VKGLGIEEVLSAPRSPWQSPYVERLIGSIRRLCLDNVVVLHQRHLYRILTAYFEHYHRWRCHQGLDIDCPEPRPIQSREQGERAQCLQPSLCAASYDPWVARAMVGSTSRDSLRRTL
jgi:transposase InsO family protein